MKRIRRPASDALPDGLTAPLVHILLDGWGGPPPPGGYGADDPFVIFELTDSQWEALWRAHRAFLLQEWRRRGQAGRCWAQQEFGDVQ